MRGDATLSLRLLTGPAGRSGGLLVLGGAVVAVASVLPWYAVVATVEMLGEERTRSVSVVRGVPDLGLALVAGGIGVALVVLGVAVGIDRPLPATTTWLASATFVGLLTALLALLRVPDSARLASPTSRELDALRDDLPVGVDLSLGVQTRAGPWLVVMGVGLAVAGAVLHRRNERTGPGR